MTLVRTILAALALMLLPLAPAGAQPVNSGHVTLELVPGAASSTPGQPIWVALHQQIARGWHTYWRNPGDAGEPPKLGWTLPAGWSAGDIAWPAPQRLQVPPLMDYGYQGEVYLPVKLAAPATARPGSTAHLTAAVTVLVCKDVCIPEEATLRLDLPVAAAPGAPNPVVAATVAGIPKPARLAAAMAMENGKLKLAVTGNAVKGAGANGAYFFPYASTAIKHAAPQAAERGPDGLTLSLTPSTALAKGDLQAGLSGVLEAGGRSYELTAKPGPLPAGARGLGPIAQASTGGDAAQDAGPGLGLALAFAVFGGAILNLMPCVFPILSMKVLAVASHAGDGGKPRAQAIAFLAGVLVTFLGLAAALLAAKAAGAAVGWGFQLQSPAVVAALALLVLLIGLNLSGVFEAGLSLQQAANGPRREGLTGSVLTGVLAVVVAAPCTAPFMAGAIGWALTQPAALALAVFAALGLGFAAPLVLLSFAPGLLKFVPRPGPWMEGLKKLLAFPMYGAAAWLVWVLTQQSGPTALAAVLAAGVALALGAWIWGAAQQAQAAGSRPVLRYGLGVVAIVVGIGLAVAGLRAEPAASAAAAVEAGGSELPSEPYDPARLVELTQSGRPVFVDFTAAWCITCQVNERVALFRPDVAKAFAKANAVYMRADWTRRDAGIAKALSDHNRAGVPLYLVYDKSGGEQVLPQVLTPQMVTQALVKAAG